MVKYSDSDLDGVFTALGDPVRRGVVRALATGERTMTDLADPFDMTMPAVMKHVAVLERCGLVHTEKRGRTRYCRLDPSVLKMADDWIEDTAAFWSDRLEALKLHVEENP